MYKTRLTENPASFAYKRVFFLLLRDFSTLKWKRKILADIVDNDLTGRVDFQHVEFCVNDAVDCYVKSFGETYFQSYGTVSYEIPMTSAMRR